MSNKEFVSGINGIHSLKPKKKKINKSCRKCLSKTKIAKNYGDKKDEWYCLYYGTIIEDLNNVCKNFR